MSDEQRATIQRALPVLLPHSSVRQPTRLYSCCGPTSVLLASHPGPTAAQFGFYSGPTPKKSEKLAESSDLQSRKNFFRATSHGRDRLEKGKTSFNNRGHPWNQPGETTNRKRIRKQCQTVPFSAKSQSCGRKPLARRGGQSCQTTPKRCKRATNRCQKCQFWHSQGAYIGTPFNTN